MSEDKEEWGIRTNLEYGPRCSTEPLLAEKRSNSKKNLHGIKANFVGKRRDSEQFS
jgi:hypothetical protein